MSIRIIAKVTWKSPKYMSDVQAEQYFIRQIEEALTNNHRGEEVKIKINGRYKE